MCNVYDINGAGEQNGLIAWKPSILANKLLIPEGR